MKLLLFLLFIPLVFHAEDKPNIILILADDLGYADVSFGAKDKAVLQTPAIDRIANEGVTLNRFYACPVCSPTRVGTMTGQWPLRQGLMKAVIPPWRDRGIDPELKTLPKILGENGYKRRAIMGKWHLGHSNEKYHPLNQGFTHFYGHLNGAIDYFTHERANENDWHRNEKPVFEEGFATDLLAKETVSFIEKSVKMNEPFFIYLPFNAPHSPFQAPEEDINAIDGLKGNQKIYAAMVRNMDNAVKSILDKLDQLKIADNTFILFYSDNGGVNKVSFKNHLRDGKFSVYEGGTRVVAAARWPKGKISGGKLINSNPIGYIDVLPTLCAAAGIDFDKYRKSQHFDGQNVLRTMQGKSKGPERLWFSYIHQNPQREYYSVIKEPYKLVRRTLHHKNGKIEGPIIELYNLNESEDEKLDISSSHPELVNDLSEQLEKFMKLEKNPLPFYSEGKKGFKAPKDWVILE